MPFRKARTARPPVSGVGGAPFGLLAALAWDLALVDEEEFLLLVEVTDALVLVEVVDALVLVDEAEVVRRFFAGGGVAFSAPALAAAVALFRLLGNFTSSSGVAESSSRFFVGAGVATLVSFDESLEFARAESEVGVGSSCQMTLPALRPGRMV